MDFAGFFSFLAIGTNEPILKLGHKAKSDPILYLIDTPQTQCFKRTQIKKWPKIYQKNKNNKKTG